MATKKSATKKKTARKSSTANAGNEIREEMHEAKRGKMSRKQAIAIGLSRARRAGKDVPPPKKGTQTEAVRKKAKKDIAAGKKTAAKKRTTKKAAKKSR